MLKVDFDYGVFCECWVFGRLIGILIEFGWGSLSPWMAEMFERLINWREHAGSGSRWLEPGGRLLMRILPISTRIATRPRSGLRRDCSSSATSGLFGYAYGREWASAISG